MRSSEAVTSFFDGLQEKALRDRDARRSGTEPASARLRPSSACSASRPEKFTAAPTLIFRMGVTDRGGSERSTRSHSRRRSRSTRAGAPMTRETRELLVDLFGEPERWAATTTTFQWTRIDVLLPELHGRGDLRRSGALHLRPRGRGDQVLLLAARRPRAATARLLGDDLLQGRRRPAADRPGAVGARREVPHARQGLARDDRPPLRERAAGSAPRRHARAGCARVPSRRAPVVRLRRSPTCSTRPTDDGSSSTEIVRSLLYEGYALYPYTPGATKNATPTPFGIVYPPVYAARERRDLRPRPGRVPVEGDAWARRGGRLPAADRRAPRGDGALRLSGGTR